MAAADGGQAELAVPSLCPRAPPGPGRAPASPAMQSSASAGPETTGCPHHETPALTQRVKARHHRHFHCRHLKEFLLHMHSNISIIFFKKIFFAKCHNKILIDQKGCLLICCHNVHCPHVIFVAGVWSVVWAPRAACCPSVVPGVARHWRLRAP